MRYFKYKNTNKTHELALKEQYKAITCDKQLILRKRKRWETFSTIISLIIFITTSILGIYLLKIIPQPSGLFWYILVSVVKLLVFLFIILVVCGFITVVLTAPLWRKVDSFHLSSLKKKIFSEACRHLRKFYGLKEPYIVTKCFDATDKKFQNHDVCIFVVDDELRITTDLIRGFLHGKRDLGCYAFIKNEIVLSKQESGKHLIAELKVDDMVFMLGYRAKGFIEKYLIAKK